MVVDPDLVHDNLCAAALLVFYLALQLHLRTAIWAWCTAAWMCGHWHVIPHSMHSSCFINNTEIQDQRHRTWHIYHVSYQFDVTTMMTPVFNHLVGLGFLCCVKKVTKLIDRPVVSLLGTRMDGTSTEMITQNIYLKLVSSNHKWLLRDHWDQPTHRLEKENTSGGVFFLRLKTSHLHP